MVETRVRAKVPLLSRSDGLLAFIRVFAAIDTDPKVFPKNCRTCGRVFRGFADYVRETTRKGHVLEDCSDVMGRAYTMIYRHCPCGNTLVLTVTDEVVPELDDFWAAVNEESEKTGKAVREVLAEFIEACDDFIISGRGAADPADTRGRQ